MGVGDDGLGGWGVEGWGWVRMGWGWGPAVAGRRSVFPRLRFDCCRSVLSNRGAVIHRLWGLLLGFQEQAGASGSAAGLGAPGGPGTGVWEWGSGPHWPGQGKTLGSLKDALASPPWETAFVARALPPGLRRPQAPGPGRVGPTLRPLRSLPHRSC